MGRTELGIIFLVFLWTISIYFIDTNEMFIFIIIVALIVNLIFYLLLYIFKRES